MTIFATKEQKKNNFGSEQNQFKGMFPSCHIRTSFVGQIGVSMAARVYESMLCLVNIKLHAQFIWSIIVFDSTRKMTEWLNSVLDLGSVPRYALSIILRVEVVLRGRASPWAHLAFNLVSPQHQHRQQVQWCHHAWLPLWINCLTTNEILMGQAGGWRQSVFRGQAALSICHAKPAQQLYSTLGWSISQEIWVPHLREGFDPFILQIAWPEHHSWSILCGDQTDFNITRLRRPAPVAQDSNSATGPLDTTIDMSSAGSSQKQPLTKEPPPKAAPPPQKQNPRPSGPQNQDDDQDKEDKRQARRNCCKKALKFMFSHIGLCGMVVAYSIAGGFIFQHLEKTNEKQECVKAKEKYDPLENSTKYNMWDISSHFRKDEDIDYALVEFQKQLVKFRDDVLALSYDGTNCSQMGEPSGPGYQWSFPGALLFSVTVITTIGKVSFTLSFASKSSKVLTDSFKMSWGITRNMDDTYPHSRYCNLWSLPHTALLICPNQITVFNRPLSFPSHLMFGFILNAFHEINSMSISHF